MIDTIPSRGKLEAEISQAVIRFEREFMGRGPLEARTYLVDDMVLVRLKGVLTVAEQRLANSGERGPELVRQMRQELIDQGRPLLEKALTDALGVSIRSVHTDICPQADERVIVFSLAGRPALPPASATATGTPRPPRRKAAANAAGKELTEAGHPHMISN